MRAWLSQSIAKVMLEQSPLHAWYAHPMNPDYKPEEKEAFDIGSAAHALLLEGEDRMVVIDAEDWRTKAAKEARDAARAEGKHPIMKRKYADVFAMVKAAHSQIAACSDLSGLTLANCDTEHQLEWESDCTCRGTLDALAKDRRVILDYKTTSGSASPEAWIKSNLIYGFGAVQAVFYQQAVYANYDKLPRFIFAVQETYAPFAMSFIGVSPSMLELADRQYAYACATWAQCIKDNKWPAYSTRIHWAEAQPWQMAQEEEREYGKEYDPAVLFGESK